MTALFMASCDDTTENIGHSVTNKIDGLSISDASYNVTTESQLLTDNVLSNSRKGIIGMMRDPETNTYVTADYMTQFAALPTFALDTLEYIKAANGDSIKAMSCYLLANYETTYGDTLAPMTITTYEMSKPLEEGKKYYTDFDPIEEGYIDTENTYQVNTTYSLKNKYTRISLNKPYTKDGVTYDNYGTYIMQMRLNHPEYFKNYYQFVHHVCPGFYLKHESGVGNMAKINTVRLLFSWKRQKQVKSYDGLRDSIARDTLSYVFYGTEEVLQANHINNNKSRLQELVEDNSCAYIKSPAGIMTIATLPVEDIMNGHEKDTLALASVTFPRKNNETDDVYAFDAPSNVLMIPVDSLTSFFEKGKVTDYRVSYSSTYNTSSSSTTKNAYTFPNISNLVTAMSKVPQSTRSANWNKVAIIPVDIDYITRDGYQYVNTIRHDMGLTSVKIVKGRDTYDSSHNPTGDIQIKVIYSKFKQKE